MSTLFRIRGARRRDWHGSDWVLLDLADPKNPEVVDYEAAVLRALSLDSKPTKKKLKELLDALPVAHFAHARAESVFNGEEGLGVEAAVVLEPESGLWYGECLQDDGDIICSSDICWEDVRFENAKGLAQKFADMRAWHLSN